MEQGKYSIDLKQNSKREWYINSVKVNVDNKEELEQSLREVVKIALQELKEIDSGKEEEAGERVKIPERVRLKRKLDNLRKEIIKKEDIEPEEIFSLADLGKLADFKPRNLEEMGHIFGLSKEKVERFGERFLEVLKRKEEKAKERVEEEVEGFDGGLFEKLRGLRFKIAEEEGMPPYIVFDDKTLKRLAKFKPASKEEMLRIKGIKDKKFEKYGGRFLGAIKGD